MVLNSRQVVISTMKVVNSSSNARSKVHSRGPAASPLSGSFSSKH